MMLCLRTNELLLLNASTEELGLPGFLPATGDFSAIPPQVRLPPPYVAVRRLS